MGIKEAIIKVIKSAIFLVFLTPLILGPFGLNMSEYPKAVFFRSLIEIVFVFYVFLVLLDRAYLPKKSVLLFSVIIFDTILIIASIAGINFYRSFFGDMQRGEGIILHLHLLVFFVVLISLFRKKEDWLLLFKASVIISGLSSVAAVLQQLKVWSFYNVEPIRLSGTLSNPDLFGSYLVLSIFLTIFLFISEKKKSYKILWIFLIIFNLYTLILSETRAAWVGFAIGVVSIYLLNYKNLNYKKRIYSLLIILFVSLLALLFPFAVEKFHMENNRFSQRILSIYNIDISNRLNLYEAAFTAFKDRPYLGWGFESFSFVSDKYLKTSPYGVYFDRPHDKILEVLVYGGIIGLISYLLIFFILFYLIIKYAKLWDGYNNKPGILFGSIIFAFFVSGFVQNIFSFDNITTYILFFLVAGFINNNFSDLSGINFKNNDKPVSAEKIIFIASVALLMGFVLYQINIRPTIAAMYFPEYIKYESTNTPEALDGYKRAISMDTIYNNDFILAYVERSISLLENSFGQNSGGEIVGGLLELKPVLYENITEKDMRPNDTYEFLSRTDEWSYIVQKKPSYLEDMQEDLNRAMSFNPNMSVFYQLKGELEILKNNYTVGEEDIRKSCYMNIGCNGNQAQTDEIIGIAYFKKGDVMSAVKNFQNALDIDYTARKRGLPSMINNNESTNYKAAQFINSVAIIYYNYLKDFEDCKKVYEKGIEVYPEYSGVLKQRLAAITADYEKKK